MIYEGIDLNINLQFYFLHNIVQKPYKISILIQIIDD